MVGVLILSRTWVGSSVHSRLCVCVCVLVSTGYSAGITCTCDASCYCQTMFIPFIFIHDVSLLELNLLVNLNVLGANNHLILLIFYMHSSPFFISGCRQ